MTTRRLGEFLAVGGASAGGATDPLGTAGPPRLRGSSPESRHHRSPLTETTP